MRERVWHFVIQSLPGAYAQADSVEQARAKLAEVIEDYFIVALQKGAGQKLLRGNDIFAIS